MLKIQEMKQKTFNVINGQLDRQAQLIKQVTDYNLTLSQGIVSAGNLNALYGGNPQHFLTQANQTIAQNFTVVENVLKQEQANLAQINSNIANNRKVLQNLNTKLSTATSSINVTQSLIKETQVKIAEATKHQQVKQQEYSITQKTYEQLSSSMTPKQVSFVLQKSIEQRDEATINLLISKNFEVNFQNGNQDSLLHTAIKYNHQTVSQKLIAKYPNVNITDKDGNSPLHLCVQKQDLPTLKKLMTPEVNINLTNKAGSSLLHKAAETNNLTIVKYLLEECPQKNAINVNIRNAAGKTCADIASGAVKNYLDAKLIIMKAELEYDNPILNHPELIEQAAKKFGPNIIQKLIEFGAQFTDTQDNKDLLENVCGEEQALSNLLTLIGINEINTQII